MPDFPKSRDDLRALAKRLGRKLDAVIALSDGNDPWFAELDYRDARAHWFFELFQGTAITTVFHVRRIFYALISQKTAVSQSNGKPFENTDDCFTSLSYAIRDARYLNLISTDIVEDRRNPPPILNLASESDDKDTDGEISVTNGVVWTTNFGMDYRPPRYTLPSLSYSAPTRHQRYHLEIWIEKSTMNDVLMPLGREYGINVATFVGEASTTACKDLVDRVIASGKPARILHVTDFDPAGYISMPVAAAVKIGYFAKKSGHDLDIRFEHVALTPEQCIEYGLPRTPIKPGEKRAVAFEERFGAGATELDALEAIHPGELRRILIGHIERFYDSELESNLEAAEEEFSDQVDDAETGVIEHFREESIPALDDQLAEIQRVFDEAHGPARQAYDRRTIPAQAAYEEVVRMAAEIRDQAFAEAERVYHASIEEIRERIEDMEGDAVAAAESLLQSMSEMMLEEAPVFEWPEPAEGDDDDDALYISERDYLDQVDRFRAHQGKDEEEGKLGKTRTISKTCEECGAAFECKAGPGKQIYCGKRCSQRAAQRAFKERHNKGSGGTKGKRRLAPQWLTESDKSLVPLAPELVKLR